MISYWFSEATKENQIGPPLKSLLPVESTTAWGDMPDSPKGSFFLRTLRNLLGFAVSEETGNGLILSSSTFALRFFSLFLIFCTWEPLSFAWAGSGLASDPCILLDFKDLVLLATSTKQFNGFQRSIFASHVLESFSVTLFGADWLPSLCCSKLKFKHKNVSKPVPIQCQKSNE